MTTPVRQPTRNNIEHRGGLLRRRPAVAFVAALVLLVAVLGIGSALLGGSDEAPPMDEPVVTTTILEDAQPESTPVPSPESPVTKNEVVPVVPPPSLIDPSLLSQNWHLAYETQEGDPAGEVAAIAVDSLGRVVGAGYGSRVVYSLDGMGWYASDVSALRDDAVFLTGATSVGSETVLAGHSCESNNCVMEMHVWKGDPELGDWARVDFGGFTCQGFENECYSMTDAVTARDGELLIVGTRETGTEVGGYATERGVWVSSNGLDTWTEFPVPTLGDLGLQEWIEMHEASSTWTVWQSIDAVAGYEDVWVMAIGLHAWNFIEDIDVSQTAILVSGDGSSWQAASVEDLGIGDQVRAFAAGPHGLVAVGGRAPAEDAPPGHGSAAAWMSTDGTTWTASSVAFDTLGSLLTGVTHLDGVGYVASGEADLDYDFWLSSDATAWEPAGWPDSGEEMFWTRQLAAIEGGLVAAGISGFDTEDGPSAMGVFVWFTD